MEYNALGAAKAKYALFIQECFILLEFGVKMIQVSVPIMHATHTRKIAQWNL